MHMHLIPNNRLPSTRAPHTLQANEATHENPAGLVTHTPGNTPLHLAADHGHLDSARLLLKARAATDATDMYRETPLHRAVYMSGSVPITELLLEWGANINCVDDDGCTPLHCAASGGNIALVKLLCSHGATRDGNAILRPLLKTPEDQCNLTGTEIERASIILEETNVEEDPDLTKKGVLTAAWLASTADCITPLHYPALVPPERARRLMRGGADLRAAIEPGGRTPLSLARELDASGDAPRGSTAWLVLRAAEAIDQGHALTGAWSRRNHYFWPPQVRARAAKLLWLGKWTVGEGEAAEKTLPLSVWVECIMPRAVAEC